MRVQNSWNNTLRDGVKVSIAGSEPGDLYYGVEGDEPESVKLARLPIGGDGQALVAEAGLPVWRSLPGVGGGGVAYRQAFTDASLTIAGLLVVTHNLGYVPTSVFVWDSSGEAVLPDAIAYLTNDALTVDFTNFRPLGGTWQLAIGA